MQEQKLRVPQVELADLCSRYHVRELAVFGSVLTDRFGSDSDIDILVEFQPEAQIGFVAMAKMQRELASLLGRQVDLVPKNGLKPLIRRSVLSSARVIYAS